jgi:hypothetical protein
MRNLIICTHPQILDKEDEVGRTCGMLGRVKRSVHGLLGKPKGKRPLRKPKRRWEDGIRMNCREIGLRGVEWIQLDQDRDQRRLL